MKHLFKNIQKKAYQIDTKSSQQTKAKGLIDRKVFIKMARQIKFIHIAVISSLCLGTLVACKSEKLSYTDIVTTLGGVWDFSNNTEYTYDTNYVEIKNGKAQLKEVDQLFSGTDFNSGTHVGTSVSSNLLSLSSQFDSSLSITNILPDRVGNLLGYWRFESNFEDSANSNDGTPVGAQISNYSYIGSNSAFFDGVDDYIDIGALAPASYTKMAWVNLSRETGHHNIISGTNLNRQAFWVVEGSCGSGLRLSGGHSTGGGTYNQVCDTEPLSLNTWYHLAITYDATNTTIKIYRNGIMVDSDNSLPNFSVTTPQSYIGAYTAGVVIGGLIDEVAYFDSPLSDSEISSIYIAQNKLFPNDTSLNPSWTPHWDNIVGYWKMDGNWQDSSGNGNHGTAAGNPTFTTSSKVGSKAGTFDGVGDQLSTAGIAVSSTTGYSQSVWFKTTDSSGGIIGANSGCNSVSASLDVNRWRVSVRDSACNTTTIANFLATTVADGSWHHFVLSFNPNGQASLFIDGAKIASTLVSSFAGITSVSWILGSALNGVFDDFSFFSTPLDSMEILTIYNRQKQKYAGNYDSPVIDLGASGSWTNLDAITSLPFGKEIVAQSSESSSDYSTLSGNLSNGLVGYWPLNETTADSIGGSDFQDYSPSANNINESGGVTFGEKSVIRSGIMFDGVDDQISVNNAIPEVGGLTNGTISLWFKTSNANLQTIYSYTESTTSTNFQLLYLGDSTGTYADESLVFAVLTGGVSTLFMYVRNGHDFYADGKWHHVAVRVDGIKNAIFVDGKEEAVTFRFGNQTTANFSSLAVGDTASIGSITFSSSTLRYFSGAMDEFSLWNRGLTDTEIQQLYRRGANRIKYQVKSCVDSSCNCKSFNTSPVGSTNDCDGDGIPNSTDTSDIYKAEFMGPGGNGVTSFSELYNRSSSDMTFNCGLNTQDSDSNVCVDNEITLAGDSSASSPSFDFSLFPSSAQPVNNRYFQYRVMMEAEDNTACSGEPCMPELTSVKIGPTGRYFSGKPSVVNKTGYTLDKPLEKLEEVTSGYCDTSYQISKDGTNFYYWNGSAWATGSDSTQANDLVTLNNNIKSFTSQIGYGNFFFRSYLGNSNFNNCSLDNVKVIKSRQRQ